LIIRHTKDASDAFEVSNANLDMGLSIEAGSRVYRVGFQKDAFDRVECWELGDVADFMKVVYDGAIQTPEKCVWASGVFEHRHRSRSAIGNKIRIGAFNCVNSRRGDKIEAKTKIDYCPDHVRIANLAPTLISILKFAGEFQTPQRIRFPEINARTQPIPIIVASVERDPDQKLLRDQAVASMVTQHK